MYSCWNANWFFVPPQSLCRARVTVSTAVMAVVLCFCSRPAAKPKHTHIQTHTRHTHTCSSPWEPADSNKTLRRHLKNAFWILNFSGWWAQKMSSHVVFFFKSLGTQKYSPGFEWVCIFNRSILQIQFLLNYRRPQKLCVSNLLLKNPKKFHSVGSIEALLPCKRFFHSAVLPLTGYDIKKTKKNKKRTDC